MRHLRLVILFFCLFLVSFVFRAASLVNGARVGEEQCAEVDQGAFVLGEGMSSLNVLWSRSLLVYVKNLATKLRNTNE